MKDIRKHKKVYIEWADAFSEMGWKDSEDIDDTLLCVSIGFLVKETKNSIAISTTINRDGDYTDPLVIPKGMICKRKRILL